MNIWAKYSTYHKRHFYLMFEKNSDEYVNDPWFIIRMLSYDYYYKIYHLFILVEIKYINWALTFYRQSMDLNRFIFNMIWRFVVSHISADLQKTFFIFFIRIRQIEILSNVKWWINVEWKSLSWDRIFHINNVEDEKITKYFLSFIISL